MKVWLLHQSYDGESGEYVFGVYTTKEKADREKERLLDLHEEDGEDFYWYRVSEREIE